MGTDGVTFLFPWCASACVFMVKASEIDVYVEKVVQ